MERQISVKNFDNGCYGHCRQCNETHRLGLGDTVDYARNLMKQMVTLGRLDVDVSEKSADPALTLDALFPGDRGHMFGVLQAVDDQGDTTWLKAFSSLRGGVRFVPGWVPPNLSSEHYQQIVSPQEAHIKAVSKAWEAAETEQERQRLGHKRAKLSKALWLEMKDLYRFTNFHGQTAKIEDLFVDIGVPGGVGECCAPKLLCEAARQKLTPKGLCEFYWGPHGEYDGKIAGQFYPCCEARCRPLLGFILCGVNGNDASRCDSVINQKPHFEANDT